MGRWWWLVAPSALVTSLVLAMLGAWNAVGIALVATMAATGLGLRALRPSAQLHRAS